MNRRDFLAGAATGAVVGAAGTYGALQAPIPMKITETAPPPAPAPDTGKLPAPAIVPLVRELKLTTAWPKSLPGFGTSAQRIADRITAMTEGTLTVKLFADGELVPRLEALDAVAKGTADMYHGAEHLWQSKSKAFYFFAAVPGGLLAPEMSAWIHYGGGQALWDEVAGGFGVKPLLCGNTGVQMGGWFNREIASPDAFKGLKFHMPGLGGEVMRRLGAEVQILAPAEIFPALQSGAIDGTEWLGPWNDLAFGFHKVAKYYYWPGFHEPGTAISLGINKGVWDSLTRTQQEIVAAAAAAETTLTYAEFMARNGQALQTLVKENAVQLRSFPDEVLQAIGRAIAETMGEVGDSDPLTKKVYESYVAFRREVAEWTVLSEQGYANARSRFFS
jgi:TRAP-type mannitol/chloroaromatic compound transport system substrate-binding protein